MTTPSPARTATPPSSVSATATREVTHSTIVRCRSSSSTASGVRDASRRSSASWSGRCSNATVPSEIMFAVVS